MTERTFDLLAEAACCAWEAMLEMRDDLPALDRRWKAIGTVELRHKAIALAPVICDVYDALGREWMEEHDLLLYDWEFVPALVKLIDWNQVDIPRPEELTAMLKDKHR